MSVRILSGDCREVLRSLPAESVHCVVTSPPYWNLRDYGTAKWEGGNEGCDHVPDRIVRPMLDGHGNANTSCTSWTTRDATPKNPCPKCGARRIDSQIGLEATIGEYVEMMVAVFQEVRRVLRKDGTLWLNLGDSYASSGIANNDVSTSANIGRHGVNNCNPKMVGQSKGRAPTSDGLKPKDLCGIPWRIAFALQADGWWLRSDIIWAKPNPMPESCTDRPTKSHEYLFLLSKSANYFWDAEAIKEPASDSTLDRWGGIPGKKRPNGLPTTAFIPGENTCGVSPTGRNRRSVWEIATSPFPAAHFATFPPALVEPCIRAGTSERGCCAKCGAPWVREVDKSGGTTGKSWHDHQNDLGRGQRGGDNGTNEAAAGWKDYQVKTLGWSSSCSCAAAVIPCTVLDCFGGAGTTGLVADRLGRNAILIELNLKYVAMAEKRLRGDAPLFAEVAAE